MIVVKIDAYFVWCLFYWFLGLWIIHIPLAIFWEACKWVGEKIKNQFLN